MQITYKCTACNKIFVEQKSKPIFETVCSCGNKAIKTFKGLGLDKEDETVSHAIELMKWAANPSGKQKTII